jgi:osmotically-inducible protein OsmY
VFSAEHGTVMAEATDLLHHVRQALASVARLDPHHHRIRLGLDQGALVLEGEVPSIAAKKLALEAAAAAAPGAAGISDRLRVEPAERQQDGQILEHVRNALATEPALADIAVYVHRKGRREPVRVPQPAHGTIDVSVADGVVTLDGEVPGLGRKRLAGVLAWWVPAAEDSDDEIAEAVRLVLEKNPFVDAAQIRVGVRNAVVTLAGIVPSQSQREMAENDAWSVFGVNRVVNHITVRP